MSKLYLNDELIWVVGGGTGAVPSYDQSPKTVTSCDMTILGGQGNTNGSNGYIRYHTCGGSSSQQGICYNEYHYVEPEIITTCPDGYYHDDAWETHGWHSTSKCSACWADLPRGFYGTGWGHTGAMHSCGGRSYWSKNCGYNSGDVVSQVAAQPGACWFKSGYTPTSQSLSCTGNGKFSVKLCDHDGLSYLNTKVQVPNYLNIKCNLIILDDTVVYYKR